MAEPVVEHALRDFEVTANDFAMRLIRMADQGWPFLAGTDNIELVVVSDPNGDQQTWRGDRGRSA